MGIDDKGQAFEIDPGSRKRGVTVLLGHMSDGEVRVFADTSVSGSG